MATLGTKLARASEFLAPTSAAYNVRASARSAGHLRFRQSLVITADLACIFSGAFLAIAYRFPSSSQAQPPRLLVPEHIGITVLYAALILLCCYSQKLYSAFQPSSWLTEFTAILKSIVFATVLLGCTLFLTGVKITSRLIVASTAVSSAITMTGWRQLRRCSLEKAIADGLSCHNVLIVGTDPLAHAVAKHLTLHRQFGFVVLGHLQTNAPPSQTPSPDAAPLP